MFVLSAAVWPGAILVHYFAKQSLKLFFGILKFSLWFAILLESTGTFVLSGSCSVVSSLRRLLPLITSNNQRLRSAGDNDRRSKSSCSNAALCVRFTSSKHPYVIRLRAIERPNARDQIVIRFILSGRPHEPGYICTMRNSNLEIRTAGSSCRPQLIAMVES